MLDSIKQKYLNNIELQKFFNESDLILNFTIWIYKDKIKKSCLYLYSQITVSPGHDIFDKKVFNKTTDKIFQKITILGKPKEINTIIFGLLNGNSFYSSLKTSKYDYLKIEKYVYDWKLTNLKFEITPAFYLLSTNYMKEEIWSSPSKVNNCIIGSLFFLDKDIFYNLKENFIKTIEYLNSETKLNFSGIDCSRIGNFEWISLLSSDLCENPFIYCNQVSIKDTGKELKGIEIIIKSKITEELNNEYIVRCRFFNKNIIFDECKTLKQLKNEDVSCQFLIDGDFWNDHIIVWKKINNSFKIIYDFYSTYLREISTALHIADNYNYSIETKRTKKISKRSQLGDDRHHIQRISHSLPSIINFSNDSWFNIHYSFLNKINKIFPKKSDGVFFKNGWDIKNNRDGFFSYVQWFSNLSKNNYKIIIFDPYFDESTGLADFLLNINNSETEVIIVERKIDNQKFIDVWNKNKIMFKGVNFKIYKSKVEFHDRYILCYNKNDDINIGFHLSNSFSGAAIDFPLLITPIPEDVLNEINNYVLSIQNQSDLILDTKDKQIKKQKRVIEKKIDFIISKEKLFKLLLNKDNVIEELQNQKIYIDEDNIIDSSKLERYLPNFLNNLENKSKIELIRIWGDFCQLLAHSFLYNSTIEIIAKNNKYQEIILNFLDAYLLDNTNYEYNDTILYGKGFENHFNYNFYESLSKLTHFYIIRPISFFNKTEWEVYFSFKIFIYVFTDKIDILYKFVNLIPNINKRNFLLAYFFSQLLEAVIIDKSNKYSILLNSDIPFLRAISIANLSLNFKNNFDQSIEKVCKITNGDEIFLALFFLLTPETNPNGEIINENAILNKAILKVIITKFNKNIKSDFIIKTIELSKNNSHNNDLFYINNLILPILKINQSITDEMCEYYFKIYFKKMDEYQYLNPHDWFIVISCTVLFFTISKEKKDDYLSIIEKFIKEVINKLNLPFFRTLNNVRKIVYTLYWYKYLFINVNVYSEQSKIKFDEDNRVNDILNEINKIFKILKVDEDINFKECCVFEHNVIITVHKDKG